MHELIPDRGGSLEETAIDKRPIEGLVHVGRLGVAGDTQVDTRHHGGVDKAVYAYAREDAAHWAQELGRDLPPGLFGENVATKGVDVTGAVVGQRWQVGAPGIGPVLKVRMPRTPCTTFQAWVEELHWVKRFTEHGAPGAYLAVETEGVVAAGDPIRVLSSPAHGVTIGEVFVGRRGDLARLRGLLDDGVDLAPSLVEALGKMLQLADG
ncbi:MAG TPA: MOSC domain-containing protein [Candidatus Limnocylindria bacterium]|nr:MOSC domain-containing protein [Candidatus Limnocylindria bacterium]